MFIIGLDASMNGSGVVKMECDDSGKILSREYLSFTSILKRESTHVKYWHPKKQFVDSHEKFNWMCVHILDFIPDGSIVAIEDYALQGKGKVFNIAEFTGIVKHKLIYEKRCKVKPIPPTSLKMWFTGNGTSDKVMMVNEYLKNDILDISFMDKYLSPQNDIVDGYALADLMYNIIFNTNKFVDFCEKHKKKKTLDVIKLPFLEKRI